LIISKKLQIGVGAKNKMETVTKCPHCEAAAKKEVESEEFSFALLVSLIPLLVFTLFGQIGLF